jgi:hypothetical protein
VSGGPITRALIAFKSSSLKAIAIAKANLDESIEGIDITTYMDLDHSGFVLCPIVYDEKVNFKSNAMIFRDHTLAMRMTDICEL